MVKSINRKRIAIVTILCLQATGFFYDNSQARSYPLKEVSKIDCKKDNRDSLSANCKEPLPRIKDAQYNNYINDTNYTMIYTTLWGASYNTWRAYGKWSHEWVDIATSEWTPVYSIGDGVVNKARAQAWYGNVVVIKHIMADKKVIYSIYWHLNKIIAVEGKTIKEWDLIGTVWNEWFSFGNHLLWDINISPSNTYAFWWCPDYGDGTTFSALENVVDNGLCRDYLTQRTIDPIAFIESNGNILGSALLTATTTAVISKNIILQSQKPTTSTAPTITTPAVINTTSNSKISTTFSTASIKTTDAFLKKWNIVVTSNFGNTLKKWGSSSIGISITNKAWAAFAWMVDKEISITPSKQNVTLSPRVIRYVSWGKIVSLIEAKEKWTSEMIVSYGDTVLGKLAVTVK